MSKFTIKVADIPVEITSFKNEIEQYCADFLTDEPPQLSITSSTNSIELERGQFAYQYSDTLFEFLSIHRQLSDKLAEFNVFLMHGSSLLMDGEGYIFIADSGIGKSTHVRLWTSQFGNRITVINDDKPYIQYLRNEYFIYGSPWNGKEKIGNNIFAPLRYVIVIERSTSNKIRKITPESAYISLLKHTHFPKDDYKTKIILSLLNNMTRIVKFYHLKCNTNDDAALTAYRGIHRD